MVAECSIPLVLKESVQRVDKKEEQSMPNKELLKILYERSMEKIFSMSANYLMTIPKKGMEKEFTLEKEIAEMLEKMMA